MNPRNYGVTFCKFQVESDQPLNIYVRNLASKDADKKYRTALILTAKTVQ